MSQSNSMPCIANYMLTRVRLGGAKERVLHRVWVLIRIIYIGLYIHWIIHTKHEVEIVGSKATIGGRAF